MAAKVNPISPADVNMKVNIAGVEFNNPVTVALRNIWFRYGIL